MRHGPPPADRSGSVPMPTIAAAEALDSAEPGKPLTGAAAVGIELDPDPDRKSVV